MGAFEIVVGVLLILIAIGLTIAILMQEGKGGMGALTGQEQNENFGRNAGKTLSTTLKNVTKIGTIAFMVLLFLLNVVVVYF